MTFKLNEEDRHSNLWRRLTTHFESRLAILRAQNDADSTEHETARRRGEIAAVKAILALNDEPKEF